METTMLNRLLIIVLLLGIACSAWCDTVYVRDVIYVPLRTGKGVQFRIIEDAMVSGTKLNEIRQEEDERGVTWAFVETAKGNQGWLEAQYVQAEPVAKDRLAAAEQQLTQLRTQQQGAGGQIANLESRNAELNEQLRAARDQIDSLSSELDNLKRVSADAINLDRRNQGLIEERETLKTRVDVLENLNQKLSDDARQTWFLYGAIAVGLGCLLTLIVQKVRIKRRYSEWA